MLFFANQTAFFEGGEAFYIWKNLLNVGEFDPVILGWNAFLKKKKHTHLLLGKAQDTIIVLRGLKTDTTGFCDLYCHGNFVILECLFVIVLCVFLYC